jgi:alkylation response protein AidB-like acyl-CoA dehydrogenase
MRFELTDEQTGFAAAIDKLLSTSDAPAVARAWAADDTGPGLALWKQLADLGINALLTEEAQGGAGAEPIDVVVAFEQLGRHAVPGPWVESAVFLPVALGSDESVGALAEGGIGTVCAPPHVPYALDADVAEQVYVVDNGVMRGATTRARHRSVDPTRRLFEVVSTSSTTGGQPTTGGASTTGGQPTTGGRSTTGVQSTTDRAFDLAVLAASAQLLGCGERLLADSVGYVKQRKQFGREIGSYQAIKHHLADVRIALDFARPLIQGAALTIDSPDRARDVSAAKVAVAEAAYLAARTGLQVHGAIGYTAEFDLSLWITKVRALVAAWGTPAYHRGRVLAALTVVEPVETTSSTTGER